MGVIPWADAALLIGTVPFFNWVYYRTGRSVLLVMIFHAMNNALWQVFPSLFIGIWADQFALLRGELWLTAGILLVLMQWRFWTRGHLPRTVVVPPSVAE